MEANGLEIRSKEIELVPLNLLIPYEKNMHKHSDEQIERLCHLIRYQGFRDPLIVQKGTNIIAAGHGRWLAAKKLEMEKVPVVYQEFESEEQFYAFVVSHNAIGKNDWAQLDLAQINVDLEQLGPELNIEMFGLKEFTIEPMDRLGLSGEVTNGPSALDKLEKYLGKEFLEVRLEYNQQEYDEFINLATPLMETYRTENLSDALLRFLKG